VFYEESFVFYEESFVFMKDFIHTNKIIRFYLHEVNAFQD
jgi:hypothetical protein